jgi:hypothetical protein
MPPAFCWSKMGVEAGESLSAICARKDSERESNGNIFLWGIGSSIRPSLEVLLATTRDPEVWFTPIIVPPAPRDVSPKRVVRWIAGVALDSSRYEVPPGVLVTSRWSERGGAPRHYALVCKRSKPLDPMGDEGAFTRDEVRNLRTGSVVGASQVTSVVAHTDSLPGGPRYRAAFRATLVYPYLVTLTRALPTAVASASSSPADQLSLCAAVG